MEDMKNIFIKRYEDAVYEYFDYTGDREGKTIRNYVCSEYKKILEDVFKMPESEISAIYQRLYAETYYKGINYRQMEEWLKRQLGNAPTNDQEGIIFYYRAMHDYDMGVMDADDYAWLNTLFRYDIGAERALDIIRWYYEKEDATVMDSVSIDTKETLKTICEDELGLHLDFSHWPKTEPKYIEFGFEMDSFRDYKED